MNSTPKALRAIAVASGPSYTSAQAKLIADSPYFTLAVNRAWEPMWGADAVYVADAHRTKDMVRARGYEGIVISTQEDEHVDTVYEGRAGAGLCRTQGVIHYGGNGGYQALGVLYQMGFTQIILVGYDYCEGPQGQRHFHPHHPDDWGNFSSPSERGRPMAELAKGLKAAGVHVVNASERTSLTCFQRQDLHVCLR